MSYLLFFLLMLDLALHRLALLIGLVLLNLSFNNAPGVFPPLFQIILSIIMVYLCLLDLLLMILLNPLCKINHLPWLWAQHILHIWIPLQLIKLMELIIPILKLYILLIQSLDIILHHIHITLVVILLLHLITSLLVQGSVQVHNLILPLHILLLVQPHVIPHLLFCCLFIDLRIDVIRLLHPCALVLSFILHWLIIILA